MQSWPSCTARTCSTHIQRSRIPSCTGIHQHGRRTFSTLVMGVVLLWFTIHLEIKRLTTLCKQSTGILCTQWWLTLIQAGPTQAEPSQALGITIKNIMVFSLFHIFKLHSHIDPTFSCPKLLFQLRMQGPGSSHAILTFHQFECAHIYFDHGPTIIINAKLCAQVEAVRGRGASGLVAAKCELVDACASTERTLQPQGAGFSEQTQFLGFEALLTKCIAETHLPGILSCIRPVGKHILSLTCFSR